MFSYVVRLFFLMLLLTTAAVADEKNDQDQDTGPADGAAPPTEEDSPLEEDSLLDRQKQQVDTQVQNAARWVDTFFQDENYEAEVATSQFRLRPELHYRSEQGLKARAKVSLKLSLPNVNRKISLVVGHDPDEGSFDDSIDEPGESSVVGLQFFGHKGKHWHSSLSAGIKFNDFALFVGPRVRYEKAVSESSSYRLMQTVRWQTNNRWQVNSRVDINHAFGDQYFFRQMFDGRWRAEKSDEEGYRTRISSFLTQHLRDFAGLQYEFTTIFHTRPDTHVDRYTLALRYRKRTSREWLYYEIVPEVSFENEFDYKSNPGLRLRLEFFFGTDSVNQFYKRELEDTDNFRW